MLTLEEKIHNLETIINQNVISQKNKQILLKEIKRLKQELNDTNGIK